MDTPMETAADLMRYKKADLVERIIALQQNVDQWNDASAIQPVLKQWPLLSLH